MALTLVCSLAILSLANKFAHPLALRTLGSLLLWLIRWKGGGFVKIGQLLATRQDLFATCFLEPLRSLHEAVSPQCLRVSLDALPPTIRQHLVCEYEFHVHEPIGSGSVAQIFSAKSRENGELVAIKIVRSQAKLECISDCIAVMNIFNVTKNFWKKHHWPLPNVMYEISKLICLQHNMVRESRFQSIFRDLYGEDVGIKIPKVILSPNRSILIMEQLEELTALRDLQTEREVAVVVLLRLLLHMIFLSGVLHLDFHPGNVFVDKNHKIVLLDFGLTCRLAKRSQTSLARFLLALIAGDSESAADLCEQEARQVSRSYKRAPFLAELDKLLAESRSKSVSSFDLSEFSKKLFEAQARHGLVSTIAFALPVLALISFEGELKALLPELDFQREILPFALAALEADQDG